MAISGNNLSLLNFTCYSQRNHFPSFSPTLDFRLSFPVLKSHSKHKFFVSGNDVSGDKKFNLSQNLDGFVRPVFSGASWWSFPDHKDIQTEKANFATAFFALRRIWGLISYDNQWVIFVAFGALTAAALSEITIPRILTTCIFSALSGENVLFSRSSNFLVILWFTSGICSGLRSGFFGLTNVILLKRIRETLYSAIIYQDVSYFDQETVGDLTSRLGADCQKMTNVIGDNIHLITRNFLQGAGAMVNLMFLSWPLAFSSLVICSILSTIFLVYCNYQMRAAWIIQEYTACANEAAEESLSLIKTIRVYGTEDAELRKYNQWLDKLAFVNNRESVAYGIWNWSFSSLFRLTQVLAVLLGGMSTLCGPASPEQLTKYVLYCEWLIYATWRVTDNLSVLLQSMAACQRVFNIMDRLPSEQFLSKGVKLQQLKGHIQFVNVSFHYLSREPILECLNMTIQANEVVAIVGLSGSGKSTLVNLLLRLYEPIDGQIYVDGFPLRDLDISWVRENVGFVGQESHLFRKTIKSNLQYGCVREIKQKDMEMAAKQAHAHDFISSLPDGYETVVDNNLLSGGQKQRIAIARGILRDPAILILDEPTSALDLETEHLVKEVLYSCTNNGAKRKRTVIVISHRLSTIKAADKIIVMDSGRIAEIGDHEALLLKDGLYARLSKASSSSST